MPNHINWCFTKNNYTENDVSHLRALDSSQYAYLIFGKEVAETGTPHLQGYVRLVKRCGFASIKALLPEGSHIEPARGTAVDNRTYCSKEGDYVELGEFPSGRGVAGSSSSKTRDAIALEFKQNMDAGGEGLGRFIDENPGAWYFSGHNLLRNHLACQPCIHRPSISARWYHGPPGCGKSRRAHAELPDAYLKDPRTKWWSGYVMQKSVIIDDFGPNGIDINHLLRWFDRYKCNVETKGGMCALHADTFIVTSNFTPSEVYFNHMLQKDHDQLPALMRRLTVVGMRHIM